MRVTTKLALGYGVLILLMTGLLAYHVSTIRSRGTAERELATVDSRAMVAVSVLKDLVGQLEEDARKYLVTRDVGYAERLRAELAAFGDSVRAVQEMRLDPEARAAVDALAGDWVRLRSAATGVLEGFAIVAYPERFLEPEADRVRAGIAGVEAAQQAAVVAQLRASNRAASQAVTVSWGAVLTALTASALIILVIVRSITGPLARLSKGARAVAAGDFSVRLPSGRGDEFADLARSFNTMVEKLDDLERTKREFLTTVSHDLKSPLVSVQEVMRALGDELAGPLNPRQARLIELGLESSERLYEMIAMLLELSALEAGAADYAFAGADVTDICRQVTDGFGAGLTRGRVVGEYPYGAVQVRCDAARIRQVLENLIQNALKYSPEDAPVSVGVVAAAAGESMGSDAGAEVTVRVEDSGPGVPPGERAEIFERFYRGRAAVDSGTKGVGLGLAICREIILAHGGRIWVEEREGGGGAAFCFTLPAVQVADIRAA